MNPLETISSVVKVMIIVVPIMMCLIFAAWIACAILVGIRIRDYLARRNATRKAG